jgi:chorismate mutase
MLQEKTLDELRAKIDQIDDALHDLLILRAEVTRQVARAKKGTAERSDHATLAAMRPAREAQILRRLLARHRGELPRPLVVRLWREIMAASLQAQAKFELHVYAGENQRDFVDLATAYFGSLTPVRTHVRAALVVHACSETPTALGVVPASIAEPALPWWSQLAPPGQPGPRILARLPFLLNGDPDQVFAYAIGAVEQEESGDDTTLLRLETARSVPRAVLSGMLKSAGFDAEQIATGRSAEKSTKGLMLLAAKGFVSGRDARLEQIRRENDVIARIDPVGGYANPIPLTPEEHIHDPRA